MAYEKKNALAVLNTINLAALSQDEYKKLSQLLQAYANGIINDEAPRNVELLKAENAQFWQGLEVKFGLAGVDPNTDDTALKNRVLMLANVMTTQNVLNDIISQNTDGVNTLEKKRYAAQKLLRGIVTGELKKDGTPGALDKLTAEQLQHVISATNLTQLLGAFGFPRNHLLNNNPLIPPSSIQRMRQLALNQRLQGKQELLKVFSAIQPPMTGVTGAQVDFLDQHPRLAKVFENFKPPITTSAKFLQVYDLVFEPNNKVLVEQLVQTPPPIIDPDKFVTILHDWQNQPDLNHRPDLKSLVTNYNVGSRPEKDIKQVIAQLERAKTPNEVMAVTGNYTNAQALLRENQHFQLLDKIQNSGIREVLKHVMPRPVVDEQKIAAINKLIVGAGIDYDRPLVGYSTLIIAIKEALEINQGANTTAFYSAFNLNNTANNYTANVHPIADNICNKEKDRPAKHPVLSGLCRLTSDHVLINVGETALLKVIKVAKNYNEFKDALKGGNPVTAFGKPFKCKEDGTVGGVDKTFLEIFPQCQTELTESMFWELKTADNKTNLPVFDKKAPVGQEYKALQKDIKELNSLYKGIKKHIDILKDANQYTWFQLFDPVHAKDKAVKFGNLQSIGQGCDVMLEEYQYYVKKLEYIRNSIPPKIEPPPTDRKARKEDAERQKTRKSIAKEINQLKEKCATLEEFSKLYHGDTGLQGDPNDIKKIGLEGLINKARAGLNTMPILHKAHPEETVRVCKPLDQEAREIILQPLQGDQNIQHRLQGYPFPVNESADFQVVDILKPGEFLECTKIYQNNAIGRFILEKGEDKHTSNDPLNLKVVEFPTAPADCIHMVVNMAAKMIGCSGASVPTKDHPLYLYCKDPKQIQYMVTAMILMGKKNARFKFSTDAIMINDKPLSSSEYFSAQHGFFGFKKGSVYKDNKEAFDVRIGVELEKVKDYQSKSYGEDHKKTIKQEKTVEKSTMDVNRQFKAKANQRHTPIEKLQSKQEKRNKPGMG